MNHHIEALRDATGAHVGTVAAAAEAIVIAHGKRLRVPFTPESSLDDRHEAIDTAIAAADPKSEKA